MPSFKVYFIVYDIYLYVKLQFNKNVFNVSFEKKCIILTVILYYSLTFKYLNLFNDRLHNMKDYINLNFKLFIIINPFSAKKYFFVLFGNFGSS